MVCLNRYIAAFAIMIGMVELGGAAVGSIETTAEELSQLLEISITPRTVLTRAMVEQLLVDFVWCKRVWVKVRSKQSGLVEQSGAGETGDSSSGCSTGLAVMKWPLVSRVIE